MLKITLPLLGLAGVSYGAVSRVLPEVAPYGLDLMQITELELGPSPPRICLVDSGIDLDHPEFNSNKITGEDNYNRFWEENPMKWNEDINGHGTKLAGIIAAIAGNDMGIAGVADFPLYVTRGLDDQGRAYSSDVKAAIEQCVDADAKIILLALGGAEDPNHGDFYDYLVNEAGIMVVAASGNNAQNLPAFPGRYESVISVGGVTHDASRWDNSAQNIELVGPALEVVSITPIEDEVAALEAGEDITVSASNSTGSAAAYVAAAAGLVWSHFPECTNEQIRDALHRTAYNWNEVARVDTAPRSIEVPEDKELGHGLPQVYDAFYALQQHGCDLTEVDVLFPDGPPLEIPSEESSEESVEALEESPEEPFVEENIPSLDAEELNELEENIVQGEGASGGLIGSIIAFVVVALIVFVIVVCVCNRESADASSASPSEEPMKDDDDETIQEDIQEEYGA